MHGPHHINQLSISTSFIQTGVFGDSVCYPPWWVVFFPLLFLVLCVYVSVSWDIIFHPTGALTNPVTKPPPPMQWGGDIFWKDHKEILTLPPTISFLCVWFLIHIRVNAADSSRLMANLDIISFSGRGISSSVLLHIHIHSSQLVKIHYFSFHQ